MIDPEAIYKRALSSADHTAALAAVYAAGHAAGHVDGVATGKRQAQHVRDVVVAAADDADGGDEAGS
jgi:hypothetical protein